MSIFGSNPASKGRKLMKEGRFSEACDVFLGLSKKGSMGAHAYIDLAKCYFELARYPEARTHLKKALSLDQSAETMHLIIDLTNWKMIGSIKYFNQFPSFSPDGDTVAYISSRRDTNGDGRIDASDRGSVYVCNLTTGLEGALTEECVCGTKPVFSPDGRYLGFIAARKGITCTEDPTKESKKGLFLYDLASGRDRMIIDPSFRVKHFAFSQDSKRIIFSAWMKDKRYSGIYSMDIETQKTDVLVQPVYENTFPSISKWGDKLVYASWRKDTNDDGVIDFRDNSSIFLKNLVDGAETQIVPPKYNSSFPSFSPDCTKVMYLSTRRDINGDGRIDSLDNPGVYILDLASGREKCVVDDSYYNKFPEFTPDGKKIVFVSSGIKLRLLERQKDYFESKGLYIREISTGKTYRIVNEAYYGCRMPVVSPKGDKVAYVSWRKGTNRGLFAASLSKLPGAAEVVSLIDNNLK
ncbi:MAG: PD40 domain-containing protein [Endomicrobiales bacterium]|nr:PD40 domain-containing protein [Endomicrobiales bacterium]